MGFMNKLNKMKNFLFDEEEIEEKPLKKQVIRSKSKASSNNLDQDFEKTQEIDNLYMEDLPEEKVVNNEVKLRTVKAEANFEFPTFDDDDFAAVSKKPEPIIPVVKEEQKPILYQGSKRKDDIKKFKPSPIISPVYGLLDDKGKEIKKDSDYKDSKSKNKEDITFDEVRRKAYGQSDFDTLKNLSTKTIEEAEKAMEEEEKKSRAKQNKVKEQFKSVSSFDEDDMILPNISFKEIDVDKERLENTSILSKKKVIIDEEDDDDETKEQDLFNLIDSMYQGKESDD